MGAWRPLSPDGHDAQQTGGESRERGMESARRASSLPSGVFKARSPEVEQALAGPVAGVFLEHMTRLDGPLDVAHVDRPPGADRRSPDDEVDQDAICALLLDLHAHGDAPPPRLDDALASERTFVLVDLAVHGDQKAKIAATAELVHLASGSPIPAGPDPDGPDLDLLGLDRHGADELRQLVAELDQLAAAGMQTLPLLHLRRAAAEQLSQRGSGH